MCVCGWGGGVPRGCESLLPRGLHELLKPTLSVPKSPPLEVDHRRALKSQNELHLKEVLKYPFGSFFSFDKFPLGSSCPGSHKKGWRTNRLAGPLESLKGTAHTWLAHQGFLQTNESHLQRTSPSRRKGPLHPLHFLEVRDPSSNSNKMRDSTNKHRFSSPFNPLRMSSPRIQQV